MNIFRDGVHGVKYELNRFWFFLHLNYSIYLFVFFFFDVLVGDILLSESRRNKFKLDVSIGSVTESAPSVSIV